MPLVATHDLKKTYRQGEVEVHALRGVNLTLEEGDFTALVGPSGSGKTTLLNLIAGIFTPISGAVNVDNVEVSRLNDPQRRDFRITKIGFVFQEFHLIHDLRVLDNVEIPLLYRKMSGKERRRRALSALDRVGLASRVHHFPSQLSGGQQQRVAIARAIVGRPKLVLADEPTGNLDSRMGDEIMAILNELNQQHGATVVMVTHDRDHAEHASRVVHMLDGRILAENVVGIQPTSEAHHA